MPQPSMPMAKSPIVLNQRVVNVRLEHLVDLGQVERRLLLGIDVAAAADSALRSARRTRTRPTSSPPGCRRRSPSPASRPRVGLPQEKTLSLSCGKARSPEACAGNCVAVPRRIQCLGGAGRFRCDICRHVKQPPKISLQFRGRELLQSLCLLRPRPPRRSQAGHGRSMRFARQRPDGPGSRRGSKRLLRSPTSLHGSS